MGEGGEDGRVGGVQRTMFVSYIESTLHNTMGGLWETTYCVVHNGSFFKAHTESMHNDRILS